jgi:hypothetical protein
MTVIDEEGARRDKLLDSEKPSEDRFYEIRQRFKDAESAVVSMYQQAQDDVRFAFVPGNQWDTHMSALRGGRPRYEFNYLRQTIKQVLNDNRRNTPTIRVSPVENSDKEGAELRQGLIRNIEMQSNADVAYDWGSMYAIAGGFGCWAVGTRYSDDDTFDQDIYIKRIENPFSVFFDPCSREIDRSDARYAFEVDSMSRQEFRQKYPDKEIKSFDSGLPSGLYYDGWYSKENVRVCRYWAKHREEKTIYRLSDGRVVDAESFDLVREQAANPPVDPMTGQPAYPPVTVVAQRVVEYDRITVELLSGDETLEGPTEWAGKYIPLVPVWGDTVNIDGEFFWNGMVRPSRDSQIMINFSQSNMVEVVASQPKAPYMVTATMIQGYENEWQNMAVDNPPVLPYNPDPEAPGIAPSRLQPPALPAGWFDLNRQNVENLKATSGVHDASLGNRSNETSGRAILARQHEGDVANFNYSDNIAKAIQYTGVIINDLIDKIYTTEREIRILGEANEEKYIRVNRPVWDEAAQRWEKVNDLSKGKYDVTVTVGPSFTTQRMETLAALTDLAQIQGPMGAVFAYGILKYMDTPGISEFADIARKILIAQGIPLAQEEGDEPPQPQQPSPDQAAKAQKDAAQAKKYAVEAEGQALDNQGKQIDNAASALELQAQETVMGLVQRQLQSPTVFPDQFRPYQ